MLGARASAGSTPRSTGAIAEDFCDFMAGNTTRFVKRLERRHARRRPSRWSSSRPPGCATTSCALDKALEKSAVVLGDGTDADVFALDDDELEVAVQVFHVRGGRVRGQRGWVAEKDDEDVPEIVGHLLQQVYGGESGVDSVPREVLVPVLPDDPEAVAAWLGSLRGSGVDLRVPAARRQAHPAGDGAPQRQAVPGPAQAGPGRRPHRPQPGPAGAAGPASSCADAPLRIECYDISHIQGTQVVGSMVVFEDGLARKSEYRRFVVRGE